MCDVELFVRFFGTQQKFSNENVEVFVYNNRVNINERINPVKRLWNISAYLFFGVITTVINIASYKLFLNMGMDYRLSAFWAFILAVAFAFFTNRKYVFAGQGVIWHEALAFLAVRVFTFLVNLAGLILLVQFFGLDKFWSQVIVNGVIIVLNYVLSKYFVFNLKNVERFFSNM